MRNTCLNMVHKLAKRDSRVVFVGSDLSPGLLAEMKQEMPQRYYMEGVSEANVVGMAAGGIEIPGIDARGHGAKSRRITPRFFADDVERDLVLQEIGLGA